jgi:predicted GIY-YIG superfamily endonuclease
MTVINCNVIYTLKLEDECWYVGYTTTNAFKQRMHHHWDHATKGSMWTRLHKPIRVYNIDTYDRGLSGSEMGKLEDEKTLKLAKLYGTDKVRGGGYCQMEPVWPHFPTKEERRAERKANKKSRAATIAAERELLFHA